MRTYEDLTGREAAFLPEIDAASLSHRLGTGWLWLAVFSLVAAGLMSLLLALARTPILQELLENPALFRVALVVHVDLSALVWFCACACLLWSLLAPGRHVGADLAALVLSLAGTLMLCVAPFIGTPLPIMNNYVPVLEQTWFFVGLMLIAAGVAVGAVRYLAACGASALWHESTAMACVRFGMALVAGIMLLAIVCVLVSYGRMPATLAGEVYYDLLFWGGGHVLQYAYTLMALVAWIVLVQGLDLPARATWRRVRLLLLLAAVPLVAVPWLYVPAVDSEAHVLAFTNLMRWGGLAALPLVLMAFAGLFLIRQRRPEDAWLRAAALCSLTLFATGGVLGFMIRGSNTMIPAHYHGSIVGVTLALMGLVYFVLPRLGRPITLPKAAHWQPYIYAAGQLMHVTGLAWCGGYGVQRKVAGAAQGLDGFAQTAGMGLMGLGGLVSVIGGVLFLVVVIAALRALGAPSCTSSPHSSGTSGIRRAAPRRPSGTRDTMRRPEGSHPLPSR
jgi:cytochrome c oxidase subunit I